MASACEVLAAEASNGVASALRAVDCLAGETVASAFARLFGGGAGGGGALLPALTIGLTLYIAFFAISLLTGRSRIGVSALTPRMLTLGLVLTFATSWVAYSQVVWNLTTGAPDEIASVLTGSQGSATQIFGDRVDLVFAAIAEAADANKAATPPAAAAQQGAQAASAAVSGNFTPANVMWLGGLLLLLGTVGVLVTARIALAVLLAVGPVFVIFALFNGTRGLFVGWLRGLTLTAVTPLFVVVGGGVVMELLVPVVASLHGVEGVNGRSALALFVIACVHVALMSMILKVAGTMVSAWQVFGLASNDRESRDSMPAAAPLMPAAVMSPLMPASGAAALGGRAAALVPATSVEVVSQGGTGAASGSSSSRTHITQVSGGSTAGLPPLPRSRARGIGSRFAAPQSTGGSGRAGGMQR
ncbi:type IV secretion system protein [Novosphingobium sp. JCM 18896]|uniref:type IV secretion system protein n=1 Tax=Novosphingobium sp. JCM 18896 TaxID=2989731 RepID=UPI0022214978|nr:type IV secretion system protein [Novosphingobium sp. JCM 18896]MCW1429077.1 type IV secretion system protein [Novosphingobium sp. JCM 18896]